MFFSTGGKKYWLRPDVDLNHGGPVHIGSNSDGDSWGRRKPNRSRHQPGHQQNLIGEYTNSNNVTVIDGATNAITTLAAGTTPRAVAVNPVTNKIYVANNGSNDVTVIDGATNTITTLAAGTLPRAVVIDPDDVMTPLQAAAAHYRIAQGPRAGQKVLSLQLAPRHP